MTKRLLRLLQGTAVTALVLSLVGCFSSAPAYNVKVSLSKDLVKKYQIYPSIEVDMAGVNDIEALRLQSCPTTDYFQAQSTIRQSLARNTIYFSEENWKEKVFPSDSPLWERWDNAGAKQLFIIANIPGQWRVSEGKLDPRRLLLPLDPDSWPNGSDINIVITPAGLILTTPLSSTAADSGK
ncbi:hypothetical protein P0136_09855 [Lentisphaerota bacterium ZTH]|nr:hypothetical protein JYG24_12630 [Lentisphaerota bacterium]WET05668.1 hypothetical protein P0136_09855 [Lentisphaerota bacterium ZTH]